MSRVTNVVLTFAVLEDEDLRIEEINKWIAAWDDRQVLVDSLGWGDDGLQPAGVVAGYKGFEAPLYLAAFNHLPLDAFLEAVTRAAWDNPAQVQIFIKEQEDEGFRLWTPVMA